MLNLPSEIGNVAFLDGNVGNVIPHGMWGLFHWVQSPAFYTAYEELGFEVCYVKEGE